MRIEDKLILGLDYFNFNRRAGHTMSLIKGLQNCEDALLVVDNYASAKSIQSAYGDDIKVICLEDSIHYWQGKSCPVVYDNSTLVILFKEALHKLHIQEKIINNIKELINEY